MQDDDKWNQRIDLTGVSANDVGASSEIEEKKPFIDGSTKILVIITVVCLATWGIMSILPKEFYDSAGVGSGAIALMIPMNIAMWGSVILPIVILIRLVKNYYNKK